VRTRKSSLSEQQRGPGWLYSYSFLVLGALPSKVVQACSLDTWCLGSCIS
jgi:hypothetical protein